ncbi:MAG: kelch repeat-containing protein, partial [Chloroflexia bacterium]
MTKRLFGSIFMASALALLLMVVSMLFFSPSTEAGQPTTVGAAAAQSTQVAKIKQAAGTWADVAPFPTVQIEFTPGTTPLKLKRAGAAAYSLNQKIYLLGGRHGTDGEDTTLRRVFEYTPGSPGSWVQKAALLDQAPVGSRWTANMAVAELTGPAGPKIYAIGGNSIDSVPTPGVRIYDPIADAVTVDAADNWPATPARVPGGWAVVNNKLYIFGGFSALGTGSVFTDTWQFDPLASAGSKWTLKAPMNLGRGFIAGAALDGQIYAIGGDTWNGSTLVPVSNVERYDPVANTWTNMAGLPTARGDMGAWAYDSTTNYEISGRIAVAGGPFPVPDALGYLYNPTTNSWSSFPSMNHATRNYGYAQLNGYLYALGGYDYTLGTPSGANFNQRYDATQSQGTPTPTVTGTLPTSTQTGTATRTSTGVPGTNTP